MNSRMAGVFVRGGGIAQFWPYWLGIIGLAIPHWLRYGDKVLMTALIMWAGSGGLYILYMMYISI